MPDPLDEAICVCCDIVKDLLDSDGLKNLKYGALTILDHESLRPYLYKRRMSCERLWAISVLCINYLFLCVGQSNFSMLHSD